MFFRFPELDATDTGLSDKTMFLVSLSTWLSRFFILLYFCTFIHRALVFQGIEDVDFSNGDTQYLVES